MEQLKCDFCEDKAKVKIQYAHPDPKLRRSMIVCCKCKEIHMDAARHKGTGEYIFTPI